ncbi:MAG: LytTR family DNA-binding domain-containing protein [Chloroherpetonaceae bacterium]
MNVVIVEDEAFAAKRLQKLLAECNASIQVVATLDSVSSTVQWFQTHAKPDLAFFDIQLSDGISFEVFKQVRLDVPIVFTTAYNDYALQAFKVSSIDYLLKPIDVDDLRRSLEKFKSLKGQFQPTSLDVESLIKQVIEKRAAYRSRFLVAFRDELIAISSDDVAYFFSENKLTHLVRADGKKFIIDHTMEELQAELNPSRFFRANRRFIVSLQSIASIQKFFGGKLKLLLSPPTLEEVTVSRETAPEFKAWLDQ